MKSKICSVFKKLQCLIWLSLSAPILFAILKVIGISFEWIYIVLCIVWAIAFTIGAAGTVVNSVESTEAGKHINIKKALSVKNILICVISIAFLVTFVYMGEELPTIRGKEYSYDLVNPKDNYTDQVRLVFGFKEDGKAVMEYNVYSNYGNTRMFNDDKSFSESFSYRYNNHLKSAKSPNKALLTLSIADTINLYNINFDENDNRQLSISANHINDWESDLLTVLLSLSDTDSVDLHYFSSYDSSYKYTRWDYLRESFFD